MTDIDALYACLFERLNDWDCWAVLPDAYEECDHPLAVAIRRMVKAKLRPYGVDGPVKWWKGRLDPEWPSNLPYQWFNLLAHGSGESTSIREYGSLREAMEDAASALLLLPADTLKDQGEIPLVGGPS